MNQNRDVGVIREMMSRERLMSAVEEVLQVLQERHQPDFCQLVERSGDAFLAVEASRSLYTEQFPDLTPPEWSPEMVVALHMLHRVAPGREAV